MSWPSFSRRVGDVSPEWNVGSEAPTGGLYKSDEESAPLIVLVATAMLAGSRR